MLAAARAGEDAAGAVVGQAKAAWWPQVGARANLTRYQKPMLVAPIHGFDTLSFLSIDFQRTLIQGNFSLAWTIFDGVRLNRIRGAKAGAAVATASREAAAQSLIAQVSVAYLEVLTARGVLDAQQLRLDALNAERVRVEQFLAEGQAAHVELLRVDAALAEAEAERVATEARLDLAERELARLVNLPVSATRVDRLQSFGLEQGAVLGERAALVEQSLANNPEVERGRQALAAAEANRGAATAAWIPNLNLGGGYQAYSSSAGNTSWEWNAGVYLSYPLFTGGSRSNAVSEARAEVRRAQEELRAIELSVANDVDRALNSALETRALVEALSRAVQHQTEVARIEHLSLEAGAGTQTDYLHAEADLARARSILVQAQHSEIAAWVQLAGVVGQLTPEWLERNLEIAR
jgi:outer membrane protein TolC